VAVLDAHREGRRIALATSGTTDRPRRVVRSTASWFDCFPVVAELTGLGPSARVWLPGPLSGTLTLFAATLARRVGATVVADPEDATHAHLTPGHLEQALDRGASLAGVALTVAGEALPVSLRDRAVAGGAAVSHYYGAAELSFVAWGTCADDLHPFPGVEVDVRDGEIWVRSPFLAEGYDEPGGSMRRDADGFATVGDRGRWDGGRLVVLGRGTDAVTTGGATVLLADVEAALRPAVGGGLAVVGPPHATLGGVVAAVLIDPEDLPAAYAASRALAPHQRPRLWFHRESLPVTESGKTDRAALVREVELGATMLRRLVPGDPGRVEP
jgi:acyl-CoA synthetase (AMP-forming)/AMP-acid ligase II